MAKINKSKGGIRGFTAAVGAYSRGALMKICSSRLGVYWGGGGVEGESEFEDLFVCLSIMNRIKKEIKKERKKIYP